jgi:hypothetical protein
MATSGQSPLYTLQTIIQTIGQRFTPETAIGVLSLILWALVITISVKYCLFVIARTTMARADIGADAARRCRPGSTAAARSSSRARSALP